MLRITNLVLARGTKRLLDNASLTLHDRHKAGLVGANFVEATTDRFQIGDLTRTDVAQSESRLALARSDLSVAQAALVQARENFIALVGAAPGEDGKGLSRKSIAAGVEASLRRLQTDRIDLYLSHKPDSATPIEETLSAYEALIRAGKVRAIGASNSTVEGLRQALDTAAAKTLPRYEVEQPEYNLYERKRFESGLRDLCLQAEMGVIVYYSLASGFLSGKYRSKADLGKSARGAAVEKYLNPRGMRILLALDQVAAARGATPAEVALAWLIAREGVTAPIASATTPEQVDSLARAAHLRLSEDELRVLTEASEGF